MNGERQGLVKAIVDRPDDDQPRLVFADWLEDRADPRAEFIRLQCGLARCERWELQHETLFAQIEKLRPKCEEVWKQELRVNCRIYFHRGLPHRITVGAKAFSNMESAIFRHNPIGFVQITRLDPPKRDLIRKSRVLEEVQGLRLSNLLPWQIADFLPIASNKLKRLDLSGVSYTLDESVADAIAKANFGKRLEELYLNATRVDSDFFRVLGKNGGLPKLRRLEFGGGMEVALPAHFEDLKFSRLRKLKVGGQLRVIDTEQLCHAPLSKLTSFDLRGTRLPAKGLNQLLDAGAFKNSTRISLEKCNLSEKSLAVILETKAPKCTHLNLANNPKVDREFVRRLIGGKSYPALMALNVLATDVKRPDLDSLLRGKPIIAVC